MPRILPRHAIRAACEVFGATSEEVLSFNRQQHVSFARQSAMVALRLAGYSIPYIAAALKVYNYAVHHAVKKFPTRPIEQRDKFKQVMRRAIQLRDEEEIHRNSE